MSSSSFLPRSLAVWDLKSECIMALWGGGAGRSCTVPNENSVLCFLRKAEAQGYGSMEAQRVGT